MQSIGILAYGSLIDDPGVEISPLISKRISGIKTPFKIEFARSSKSRDGAPTVVPVEQGGSAVDAVILVLSGGVTIEHAKDLLWRRETRNESSGKSYSESKTKSVNKVSVEVLTNFSGVSSVLYTKISPNIDHPTPVKLAELAIASAQGKASESGKDGISYLMSLKSNSISTPLMSAYEQEILSYFGVSTLEQALSVAQKKSL